MADYKSLEATQNFVDQTGPRDEATQSTRRDLLFGRLAVLNGFVEQEALDKAIRQHATDRSQSLADLLVQGGAIAAEEHRAIEALLELHLAKHGNDPQQSLSSLPASSTNLNSPAHPDDTVPFVAKPGQGQSPHKRFGDYELLNEIARGGMGVVYKARQVKLNRIVAMKMILFGELADAEAVRRFYTEAEAAGQLRHPGIVAVHEVGEHGGQHFFSMEYVEGQSLAALARDKPYTAEAAAKCLKSVAEAIQYAHEHGVLHRDLKPSNVLIDTDGRPRVTDFGLAKRMGDTSGQTRTQDIMGTPSYMPPEQTGGRTSEIGPASDVYSLGAMLYELLTGRPPFRGETPLDTVMQVLEREPVSPRLLNPKTPRDLETICLKCLRKETAKRYATAAELATDLGNWLENRPIVARPVGPAERTWLWCKRRPTLVGMSLLLLAVSMGGGLIAWERLNAARATGLVDALVSADTSRVPEVYAELAPYRRRAGSLLRAKVATAENDSKISLHARLALVEQDPSQVEFLSQRLLQTPVEEVAVIVEFLSSYGDTLNDQLWENVKSGSSSQRIRAAAALAVFDPENAAWKQATSDVAAALVSVSPAESKQWIKLLSPLGTHLAEPLAVRYRDRSPERDAERPLAAMALGDYWRDEPDKLTELVLLADNKQEFRPLLEALRPHRSLVSAELKRLIAASPPEGAQAAVRDAFWKRQATTAVCLLELGEEADVWPLLKQSQDPTLRSFLIERLAPLGATFDTLAGRLDYGQEPDTSIRQGVILALGDFDLGQRSVEQRQQIVNKLAAIYRDDPDSGIHSAAAWTLRHWHEEAQIKTADAVLQIAAGKSDTKRRNWFINSQGQTFLVVPGPVEFVYGEKLEPTDALPVAKLSHGFAIGVTEVTMEQFRRFRPDHKLTTGDRFAPDIACPAIEVSWYDAVAYCNWLSEQEGLAQGQWCYVPNDNGEYANGMTIPADFLKRSGYRLPTEAEWECVCRGGTSTPYSFGESEGLPARYGWYNQDSKGRTWSVGALRPNLWGAQDMLGNVWELCQERVERKNASTAETVGENDSRVLRGGSFTDAAFIARSANSTAYPPSLRGAVNGFRMARTYALAP